MTEKGLSKKEHYVKILFIDDEEIIHQTVGDFLKKWGYTIINARTGNEAVEMFKKTEVDLVVSDIRLPDISGIDVLQKIKEESPDTEVILMTGHAQVDTAVKALRLGATDYILKPIDLTELLTSIERTKKYHQIYKENIFLKKQIEMMHMHLETDIKSFIYDPQSKIMIDVINLIKKIATFDKTPVLITGETGTGKELTAKAIHYLSERKKAPFISINCTAIPRELIESELFGHEKGAFTDAKKTKKGYIEAADGGTLFLDEIGDMDINMQSKILRVLEEHSVKRVGSTKEVKVNVRIISATNKNLEYSIKQKTFRSDLFYRLNVFPIMLPSLRERKEDLMVLSEYFMKFYSEQCRKNIDHITGKAQKLLKEYQFPGNIRELKNLIERAVILAEGHDLLSEHFPSLNVKDAVSFGEVNSNELSMPEVEKKMIKEALQQTKNNKLKASKLLGISHDKLRYRIKKYKINN